MQRHAASLIDSLEPIVLCQLGQTQLNVELSEYVSAEKGGQELTAFVAENLDRFKEAFGEASLDATQPEHKKMLNIRREKEFAAFRERVLEPMERIESLLNETLVYHLTIPEEIAAPTTATSEARLLTAPRRLTVLDRLTMFALSLWYKLKARWSASFSRVRGTSASG